MFSAEVKSLIKHLSNWHIPSEDFDVVLFATPRGGSTWIAEVFASAKGFRFISEPFNVRNPNVCRYSGLNNWPDLYSEAKRATYFEYLAHLKFGKIRICDPKPFSRYHRWFTSRNIFKIIHAGMDRVDEICSHLNAKPLILLRHPIPTTLSREVFPLLTLFNQTELVRKFTSYQCEFIKKVEVEGSHLERGVTAWCIHNSIPLHSPKNNCNFIYYEDCVLNPSAALAKFQLNFNLKLNSGREDVMRRPSSSVRKSSKPVQKAFKNNHADKEFLLNRWQNQVTSREVGEIQKILELFRITSYSAESYLPRST